MSRLTDWLRRYHQGGLAAQAAPVDQTRALISEIWMLVDFIAGNSSQGLNKVKVANPRNAGAMFTPDELLREISDAETRLGPTGTPLPYDRAAMQIVRDALNLAIFPASGLTVAYTTMVTGPLRGHSASRFTLARQAYSALPPTARWHRRLQFLILVVSIALTGMAVWESAKVALGKAILQNLETLRTQQNSLDAEKVKYELSLATAAKQPEWQEQLIHGQPAPLTAYRLCDRAIAIYALTTKQDPQAYITQVKADAGPRLMSYGTAEERDICGRDDVLRANLGIVHRELISYAQNWPGMVGSAFSVVRNVIVSWSAPSEDSGAGLGSKTQDPVFQDVEFRIAPMLLVWGNFVIPIIFSFIGSAIFVILDHYNKLRDSLLLPRDRALAPVRLALGLVVGACVGLFYSAYGPAPPSSSTSSPSGLIASLTLTASGVAFLAGFGVEGVFSLLEALIKRLFSPPAA